MNAGVAEFASLQESDEAPYARQLDTNVKGAFFTIQQAEPLLRDGGTVVINASVVAHIGIPGATLYSATKEAVRSLARGLGPGVGRARHPRQCGQPRLRADADL